MRHCPKPMVSVPTLLFRGAALFAAAAAGFWLACGLRPAPEPPAPRPAVGGVPIAATIASAEAEPEAAPATGAEDVPPASVASTAAGRGEAAVAANFVPPGSSDSSFGGSVAASVGDSPAPSATAASTVTSHQSPVAALSATRAASVASAPGSSAAASVHESATSDPAPIIAPAGNVAIPVAFQPLATDAGLTTAQRQQLSAVQDDFVNAIGGDNPSSSSDPASTEYLSRWLQAQSTADQEYRARFGVQAFLQRQIAQQRAAADEDTTAP